MADPTDALATHLAAQIGTLTRGTNLFRGPASPVRGAPARPSTCVFLVETGGPAPLSRAGGVETEEFYAQIQILVRSESYSTGRALARSVLQNSTYEDLTDYIEVTTLESEPNYLGQDDERHHRWTINVEMWYET